MLTIVFERALACQSVDKFIFGFFLTYGQNCSVLEQGTGEQRQAHLFPKKTASRLQSGGR